MVIKKVSKKATAKVAEPTEDVTSNPTEDVTSNPTEDVTAEEARVYDKNMRLVRTFTEKDGKDFVEKAKALAEQPRRDGWTIQVR